jgi:hypothetical protein
VGVTWTDNHYNTGIDGVSGNAATSAVYDDPDLIKTTGWRTLPTDGTVGSTWWAVTTEPSDPPPSESALLASNAYGGATYMPLRLYLFDDGIGSTLTDHSTAGADAALTNPVWSINGLDMSSVGQKISAPIPSFGNNFTVFMAWTSLATTAPYQAKFYYYYNTDYRDWQLEVLDTDKILHSYINTKGFSFEPSIDGFDRQFHTSMATHDQAAGQVCVYIDGSLQACVTNAFTLPTFTGSFNIGSRTDGACVINATLHAWYAWNAKLTAADAASLHADYDQMFTSPPTRTFNTAYTPVAVAQSGRPISVVTPGRPIVVMGR